MLEEMEECGRCWKKWWSVEDVGRTGGVWRMLEEMVECGGCWKEWRRVEDVKNGGVWRMLEGMEESGGCKKWRSVEDRWKKRKSVEDVVRNGGV